MKPATARPALQVGGAVNLRKSVYIVRPADDQLLALLARGEYCNVLCSRQMGKTSLLQRTRQRLRAQGVRTAALDVAGSLGSPPDADTWYRGLLQQLTLDLNLAVKVDIWWQNTLAITLNQRLLRFFREQLLDTTPVVIFLDEIDSTLKLAYTDDFFAAIRSIYNDRAIDPVYEKIAFCLVGVATPNELIKDRRTTPYNIGVTLELADFDKDRDDLTPLYLAMATGGEPGATIVQAVLRWTDGHPFLTQWLCQQCLEQGCRTVRDLDRLVARLYPDLKTVRSEPHFAQILRFLDKRTDDQMATWELYQRIWYGWRELDQTTLTHAQLKLSGLVKRNPQGYLVVRNAIYKRIFTADQKNLWGVDEMHPSKSIMDLWPITRQYLNYLQHRHQYLSLKGMALSERLPLQLPLLDLYVPLQARLELPAGETWNRSKLKLAGRMLNEAEQDALTGRLSKPRPVLQLLRRSDGLVILGDPGAGKTTFLKYLVLQLASGNIAAVGLGERLPILVPLSGFADALEKVDIRLDDFIAGYFQDLGADLPMAALLANALQRGAALVLLDGLDEVQDNNLRHLVVERVVDFFTLHCQAGNKFVITSRIIGYREVRPVATGLAECTLVDFNDGEIKTFVERWTKALEKQAQGDTRLALADAERERMDLLEAVERNTGVRQLAANPLLLTILALMKRQGVILPERRVELYDQYVKTLLFTWNRARGLGHPPSRDLDPVQTVKILAPLALWMHETSLGMGLVKREAMRRELETLYASRGEADPESCTRQFLEHVHDYASLLLERGPGEYGFIHLAFEEYLAAVAIALRHQGDARAIAQALGTHAGETAWHEIALLTVGYVGLVQQMDQIAGEVVEALCLETGGPPGVAVALAGEAVIDAWPAGVTPASKAKVVAALVGSLSNAAMPGEWRGRVGRALAALGDPRPGVGLGADGLPDLRWARIPGTAAVQASGRFLDFSGLRLGTGARPDPQANTAEDIFRGPETWPATAPPLEIANFALAAYPVTVAQFKPFVEQGGYREDRYWSAAGRQWRDAGQRTQPYLWDRPAWTLDNHPVVGVTWYEAEAYGHWLNEQWGLPPGALRLPTEAEWEWAARGPEGRYYPWGDHWASWRCNGRESGLARPSAVGCFPGGAADWWWALQPESEAVHDLTGNVWEWTASVYTKDYGGAHQSVLNANTGGPRVLRGGSWGLEPGWLRAAYRFRLDPGNRLNSGGFRLARTFPF